MAASGGSELSVPFHRQYVMHVGKGVYGPALQYLTPTPWRLRLRPVDTNMSYCRSEILGMGLMFSRGGFLTPFTQTNPDEKVLFAVPLYKCKKLQHRAGQTYEEVLARLASLPWTLPGQQFILQWGSVYSFSYEDPGRDVIHVRTDLCVAPWEDAEAPDSPPAFGPHNGDPVNIWGTAARLAAMSDVLGAGY